MDSNSSDDHDENTSFAWVYAIEWILRAFLVQLVVGIIAFTAIASDNRAVFLLSLFAGQILLVYLLFVSIENMIERKLDAKEIV